MLKIVTLNSEHHNEFPEPDGEILTVVDHNKRHNTLTLLVQEGEEVGEEEVELDYKTDDDGNPICGVVKTDGEECEKPPDECPWHDEDDQREALA